MSDALADALAQQDLPKLRQIFLVSPHMLNQNAGSYTSHLGFLNSYSGEEDGRLPTALHFAASLGAIKTIQWLLQYGADAAATNKDGETPADVASSAHARKAVLGEAAPYFRESPRCRRCRRPFTLALRRHHCRACGSSFCHEHSPFIVTLPRWYDTPQRACFLCFEQWLATLPPERRAAELRKQHHGASFAVAVPAAAPGDTSGTASSTRAATAKRPAAGLGRPPRSASVDARSAKVPIPKRRRRRRGGDASSGSSSTQAHVLAHSWGAGAIDTSSLSGGERHDPQASVESPPQVDYTAVMGAASTGRVVVVPPAAVAGARTGVVSGSGVGSTTSAGAGAGIGVPSVGAGAGGGAGAGADASVARAAATAREGHPNTRRRRRRDSDRGVDTADAAFGVELSTLSPPSFAPSG